MRCIFLMFLALGAAGCSHNPNADTRNDAKPDNTGVNARDRNDAHKTPIDQNENQKDIDITASIRKQIVDGDFSTNGKNCKVITQDGHVTLRGPVKSMEEKDRIGEIARSVAGATKVDNQLEVTP